MGCRLCVLALLLALSPAPVFAADEESSPAAGTGDEECPASQSDEEQPAARTDDERPAPAAEEAKPAAPAPRGAVAPPAPAPAPAPSQSRPTARGDDYLPATQSLTFEPGGAAALLAGYAVPRFVLDGKLPEETTSFATAGLAARLFWDFPAMELDWRVSLLSIFTDYYALRGTVGIRKELGPFANPKIIGRGGGGIELMLAQDDGATFLLPVFVFEGEVGVEYELVENLFAIGAGFEFTIHYGLPAGIGLNVGGYVPRLKLLF